MGDTTAKPAGDPPAFEPITTQEAMLTRSLYRKCATDSDRDIIS